MLRLFSHYLPKRTLLLAVFENLLILGAIQLALILKLGSASGSFFDNRGTFLNALFVTFVCQLCFYYHDLYDLRKVSHSRELIVRLFQALGVCAIVVAVIYLILPTAFLGEGVFVVVIFMLLGFFVTWRFGFLWVSQRLGLKQSILILGTGDLAKNLASEILARPEVGVRVVGFVSDDPALVGRSIVNPTVLGALSDLSKIVADQKVARVLVAMPDARGKLPVDELLDLKLKGIGVEEGTSYYERITGKVAVENLRPSWLVFSQGFTKSRLTLFYKRVFGFILSMVGIILTAPLMVVISVLIKLDSRGPILFRQLRVGENCKVFRLLKFRSMTVDAETTTGPVWATANDSRITRVGRWLRKMRLDELPQFVNVLRGDLSFVGPRPERPHFVEQLSKQIPYYNQRHAVKPGITGWAQVNYHYGGSVSDTVEKLQYDLFYIKNMSISLDLLVVFQTIKIVLLGRGAH